MAHRRFQNFWIPFNSKFGDLNRYTQTHFRKKTDNVKRLYLLQDVLLQFLHYLKTQMLTLSFRFQHRSHHFGYTSATRKAQSQQTHFIKKSGDIYEENSQICCSSSQCSWFSSAKCAVRIVVLLSERIELNYPCPRGIRTRDSSKQAAMP